jgi:hypothetical protein
MKIWINCPTKKYNKIYEIPKTKMVRQCGKNGKRKRSYKEPLASKPTGRPKNRWEDDVRKDLQTV